MTRKKRHLARRFERFNEFVDVGLAMLSRSGAFVYLILFRDTKPSGLARTSRTELARRGGMTERQASRALQALIQRGVVQVIRRGIPGKATLYSIYKPADLAEINPRMAAWMSENDTAKGDTHVPVPIRTRDTHDT